MPQTGYRRALSRAINFCLVHAVLLSLPLSVLGRAASSTRTLAPRAFNDKSGRKLFPKFRSVEFGNRPYQALELKDKKGRVIRQFMFGKDRTEILTDLDGNGRLDSWEIFTRTGKILFSFPEKGHFAFMDVEALAKKGVVRSRFYWDETKKVYTLFEMHARPYMVQGFNESLIVGCTGTDEEKSLAGWAKQFDDYLSGGGEAELRSNLASQAMDGSCDKAPFEGAKIMDAIMDVAKSDQGWGGLASGTPKEKGTFLQCLRHYGMDVEASRIQSGFAQYTSNIKDKFLWKIRCEKTTNSSEAEFHEGSLGQPPTVAINADAQMIKKYASSTLGTSNPTPEQTEKSYARVYFHEMLHYAMVPDPDAVTISDCCGKDTPDSSPECGKLKTLVDTVRTKQGLENILVKNTPYADLRNNLQTAWGNSSDGVVSDFLSDSAKSYNDWAAKKSCNGTEANPLGNCEAQFKSDLRKKIDATFGAGANSTCMRYSYSSGSAVENCTLVKSIIESAFDDGTLSGALSLCSEKEKTDRSLDKPADHSLYRWPILRDLIASLSGASASADTSSSFCSIATKMKDDGVDSFATALNPRPVVDAAPDYNPIPSSAGEAVAPDRGGTTIKPSTNPGKSTFGKFDGPSMPVFSNDSTARSTEIYNSIVQKDNLIARMGDFAEGTFKNILPSAQAASSEGDSAALGSTASKRASGATMDGTSVGSLPKLSVPNPLGSFGPDGVGGIALPNAENGSGVSRRTASAAGNDDYDGRFSQGASGGASSAASSGASSGVSSGGANGGGGVGSSGDPNGGGDSQGAGGNPSDPFAAFGGHARSGNPGEERALAALLTFLQNDYERVKAQLERPSVESSLLDHGVQVIDDEGRVHGSGFAKFKLIYDPAKGKLVPEKLRRPAAKSRPK